MSTITDVPAGQWPAAMAARHAEGFTGFGFLTAVDRGGLLEVLAMVERPEPFAAALVRTQVDAADADLASVQSLWAGAAWHERETAEMFGITFDGIAGEPLLLHDGAVAAPMRKHVLLPARAARPWPGSFEPGRSGANASRRRLLPPGVPADHGGESS